MIFPMISWINTGSKRNTLMNSLRIPDQACHRFHGKAATHSIRKLPPIPVNPATP
jgi:hypothetical protein